MMTHELTASKPLLCADRRIATASSQKEFSFFKAPIRNIRPYKSITLLGAYRYIIGRYALERTQRLRSLDNPKAARIFKAAQFDYCTFSGTFDARSDKRLIQHSGLLCIDFDNVDDIQGLSQGLLNDDFFETELLFRSPSGNGLKWVIAVELAGAAVVGNAADGLRQCPTEEALNALKTAHVKCFTAVANYVSKTYGTEADQSGKDISRACFLPHDPQAFVNPKILNGYGN